LSVAIAEIGVWIAFQYFQLRRQSGPHVKTIGLIVFFLLLAWELASTKYNLLPKFLLPSPEKITKVAIDKYPLILWGTVRSFGLMIAGFISATVLGIALGLWVGWNPRLKDAALPIVRVLNAVPPLIYTTYAVAFMPSLVMASIFVLFNGVFWGTLSNMAHQVGTIDKRTLDSARTLNVSSGTLLFKVILPASLPGIIGRFHVSVSISFLLLMGAEMIGADAGIGWFIRSFYNLGQYTEVFFGIIYTGIIVMVVNAAVMRLEHRLLAWMPQRAEGV
jgi:NitT/TauT family transport system permease protein